jgi:tetratricopeptide (TPR) repeat protein
MRGVMPNKAESSGPLRFAAVVLPWLLALVTFAVYLLTLNPWVAPQSLELVANVSGLNPRVELFGPVTCLVTWPFRWLPPAWIPPALNLLSAACAALSLAWLARSVALLPHDRTEDQRLRLEEGTPWLALRSAWLPPTLAVLVCGLQLTFWEHAVAATGEMFNLLLFACLVRGLLELRADGNNTRLPRLALVYGLAVANNWAMAAFAPLFFLAAVWAARANPFRLPLLERALERFNDPKLSLFARFRQALRPFHPGLWAGSLGCFVAGLCLLMLLPLLASSADNAQMDFWTALRSILRSYKRFLLAVPTSTVLLLCLGSVLPALFMTLRWGSRAGGAMAGDKLVAGMFHGLHAFFLIVCLWAALDLPLSPRRLGVGFPCLPLYYLGALSAGYFSGYFLLVFGTPPREPREPWRQTRLPTRGVNVALTAAVSVALAGVLGLMLHQSLPYILWSRTGALGSLATQLEQCLPPPGAVILSEGSFGLLCLETTLIRRSQQTAYLPMDVSVLDQDPGYFDILRQRHPEFNLVPPLLHLPSDLTNPPVRTAWFEGLVAAREVYSLRPLSGSMGESFSFQPRGLFYQLKPRAANVLDQGPLPPEVLAENRSFWQAFIAQPLPELVRHIPSPEQLAQSRSWQWLHQEADRGPERDPWAAVVGAFYSRALDIWGVELQKAGSLREAGDCFAAALQLSPHNAAAQINRDFNQDLQARKPAAIQSARQIEAQLGKRRSWNQVLALDGSVDEPNACCKMGTMFAEANLPRQAAQQFARAQTLAPGQPDVALRLAEQLIRLADYTNALAAANQALQLKPLDPDALFWKGCSLMLLKDYGGAIPLLNQSLTAQTNSRTAMTLAFTHVQLGNLDAARQAYECAAQSATNASQAYFHLAQFAYRQNDTNAAIKYIELYRSNTPPNLLDARLVDYILAELRGPTVAAGKP